MAPVHVAHVISFSSEDERYPASNILNDRKWLTNNRISSSQALIELELERSTQIRYLDIGYFNSASIEISVGRSSWTSDHPFSVILPLVMLQSPAEARAGKNKIGCKMFRCPEDLNPETCNEKWDRVRICLSQEFSKNNQMGLEFVRVGSAGNSKRLMQPTSSAPSIASSIDWKTSTLTKLAKTNDQKSPVLENLRNKLLKISGTTENGSSHEKTLSRTARMVLASRSTSDQHTSVKTNKMSKSKGKEFSPKNTIKNIITQFNKNEKMSNFSCSRSSKTLPKSSLLESLQISRQTEFCGDKLKPKPSPKVKPIKSSLPSSVTSEKINAVKLHSKSSLFISKCHPESKFDIIEDSSSNLTSQKENSEDLCVSPESPHELHNFTLTSDSEDEIVSEIPVSRQNTPRSSEKVSLNYSASQKTNHKPHNYPLISDSDDDDISSGILVSTQNMSPKSSGKVNSKKSFSRKPGKSHSHSPISDSEDDITSDIPVSSQNTPLTSSGKGNSKKSFSQKPSKSRSYSLISDSEEDEITSETPVSIQNTPKSSKKVGSKNPLSQKACRRSQDFPIICDPEKNISTDIQAPAHLQSSEVVSSENHKSRSVALICDQNTVQSFPVADKNTICDNHQRIDELSSSEIQKIKALIKQFFNSDLDAYETDPDNITLKELRQGFQAMYDITLNSDGRKYFRKVASEFFKVVMCIKERKGMKENKAESTKVNHQSKRKSESSVELYNQSSPAKIRKMSEDSSDCQITGSSLGIRCPLCLEIFPRSIISDHAAFCGEEPQQENFDEVSRSIQQVHSNEAVHLSENTMLSESEKAYWLDFTRKPKAYHPRMDKKLVAGCQLVKCPTCGQYYKSQEIEEHSDECAEKVNSGYVKRGLYYVKEKS